MDLWGKDEFEMDICCTRFVEEKVTYTWKISRLRYWPKGEYEARSPPFRDPTLNKWSIEISQDCKGYYYLSILLLSVGESDAFRASVNAWLTWKDNSSIEFPIVESHLFKLGEAVPRKYIKGFTEPKNPATDWLKVKCEVSIVCGLVEVMPGPGSTLVSDLALLLKTGEGADVRLIPAGSIEASMMAHSSILRARSDIFTAMLLYVAEDSVPFQTLELPDIEPRVLIQLLQYMYTDRTSSLADTAKELLVVAHRYQIERLKLQCELALADQLSVDNAAVIGALSVAHSCRTLQNVVVPFIQRSYAQVLSTPDWVEAVGRHPKAMADLTRLIAETTPSQ